MKFGGTSVANVDRIRAVRDIISNEVKNGWNVIRIRENPLKIKYSLLRWKKKRILYDEGTYFKHRPSFIKQNEKVIEISGKIPINKIDKFGNITPSTLLQDKIIPLSESKINYINECGIERIIYWTIYSIKCNNINQGIKYKLVWN